MNKYFSVKICSNSIFNWIEGKFAKSPPTFKEWIRKDKRSGKLAKLGGKYYQLHLNVVALIEDEKEIEQIQKLLEENRKTKLNAKVTFQFTN